MMNNGGRPRGRKARSRNTAELAARLAPPEEGESSSRSGAVDDTIRPAAEDLEVPRSAEDENEARGVFYLYPTVIIVLSVFVAYILAVSWLITDMPATESFAPP